MSCEIEALLTNKNAGSISAGQEFDFTSHVPVNVLSPFKAGNGAFNVVKGIALPYLTLERATYRFGIRQNATQQFTLRGDSILYVPGTPYYQEYTNTGAGTYSFANTALLYAEGGSNYYATAVMLKDSVTNRYKRLFLGTDYTNTSGGFTLLGSEQATYNRICVVYGSATAATYNQAVHATTAVKPAAIRGKDIDLYVGSAGSTPTFTRWTSVQSVEVNRSVALDNDQEFGNSHYVSSDYDTADVNGNVVLRPRDPDELFDRLQEITGLGSSDIIGPFSSVALPVEVRISDPDSGDVLKTLYVPDARFTIPGVQGRVQQKLEVTINFTSDGGTLKVYAGERP
jgi:hypothetical protein